MPKSPKYSVVCCLGTRRSAPEQGDCAMPTKTRNMRGWFPFALNPTTREFVARGSSSFRIAKVDSTTHRSGARCSVKGLLPCVFACSIYRGGLCVPESGARIEIPLWLVQACGSGPSLTESPGSDVPRPASEADTGSLRRAMRVPEVTSASICCVALNRTHALAR